ncbi:MAG: HI0074 family nucleotidyltransferase substrate-binding subunit [candidate division WOR-3 bacterium]
MSKLEAIIKDFQDAITALEHALKQEKNEFIRDSAILRFELAFDLSWKALKAYLEEFHGLICASPKKCFREAYKQGLLEFDNIWIEMTDARNEIAHLYKESLADELFQKLPKFLENFKKLLNLIEAEIRHIFNK